MQHTVPQKLQCRILMWQMVPQVNPHTLNAASKSDTATFVLPCAASEIGPCNFSLIQMGMAVAREMFLDLPCPS